MIESLKNKHVLLMLPKFFGYERIIASHLRKVGATVTVIYENMDEVSYFYRMINAYFPRKMPKIMNRYFLKRLVPIANKLDYVLLIRGEFLNPEVLEILKNKTRDGCKFCMYQWDSVKNNCNAIIIKDFFDCVSTFDPVDSKKFGWKYRPLFFVPELIEKTAENIDVLYMCSLHSKRIEVLNKLKKLCSEKRLKLYRWVYSKKLVYYKRKYLNKRSGYISANDSDISSKVMDVRVTYSFYNRSKIIVDYTHPGQDGFTMRTIEALGCGKKLVTNNNNVLEADFYNPNNIYVYSAENLEIPDAFINAEYCAIDKTVYNKYDIDEWIRSILGLI